MSCLLRLRLIKMCKMNYHYKRWQNNASYTVYVVVRSFERKWSHLYSRVFACSSGRTVAQIIDLMKFSFCFVLGFVHALGMTFLLCLMLFSLARPMLSNMFTWLSLFPEIFSSLFLPFPRLCLAFSSCFNFILSLFYLWRILGEKKINLEVCVWFCIMWCQCDPCLYYHQYS